MTAALQQVGVPDDTTHFGVLLPSQHPGSRRAQIPEQRLMIAVLHDALECLVKHRFASSSEGRQLFREAQRWFLADEADWPYSFESICGQDSYVTLDIYNILGQLVSRLVNEQQDTGQHQATFNGFRSGSPPTRTKQHRRGKLCPPHE